VCKASQSHRDGQRRHLSDDALLVHIKVIHAETRGGYGWPRIWKELLARSIRVDKQRVQKLMQRHGIRARALDASTSQPTAGTICRSRPTC